jgi:hypothetical protein
VCDDRVRRTVRPASRGPSAASDARFWAVSSENTHGAPTTLPSPRKLALSPTNKNSSTSHAADPAV